MDWPISYADVRAARRRIAPYLESTPLRRYPLLDAAAGGIEVFVKHENLQPTHCFKVRNGLAALSLLDPDARGRGIIAATRGNHGLGLCFAGQSLGVPVTICVPVGNNPEKNAAIRSFGARLVENGRDYDETLAVAAEIAEREGLTTVHSTNDRGVLAGAATIADEMLDQLADDPTSPAAIPLDVVVVAVGGGSQAVGVLTVVRERAPEIEVWGVQAANAPAQQLSWKAGRAVETASARTIADGLATRSSYEFTRPVLHDGLKEFLLVSEEEIGNAIRLLLETTRSLSEPAGAAGLAGLLQAQDRLQGKRVGIILSGANIDRATLRSVLGD